MKTVEANKVYKARDASKWRIIEITDGAPRTPVLAGQWQGGNYRTRRFEIDGRYFSDRDDKWDLVEEVANEQT